MMRKTNRTRPEGGNAQLPGRSASLATQDGEEGTTTNIAKLALISHDYVTPDSHGLYDYSEHFGQINRLCDQHGCDTILYALFTWDLASPLARTETTIFEGLSSVQRVILEVWSELDDRQWWVEIWERGKGVRSVKQQFGKSSQPASCKEKFIADLPHRRVQDALLVLCGETNIASLVRDTQGFDDPYHFVDCIEQMGIRLILNPIHDYMQRV